MNIDRSIAALITPRKDAKRKADVDLATLPGKAMKAVELPVELSLHGKIFDALEHVLMVLAARQRRPTLTVVKAGVESMTGRDLTEERLAQVWALAGDMLALRWVAGEIEIQQLAADGEARAPSGTEQVARRGQFVAALERIKSPAQVPYRKLPDRPPEPKGVAAKGDAEVKPLLPARPLVEVSAQVAVDAAQGSRSFESRAEAIRSRIQSREQAAKRHAARQAEIDGVEQKLRACENAVSAHSIVQHLLARGKGADATAAESEVVLALCGASLGMQNRRPLEAEEAKAALASLVAQAADWFTMEVGQFTGKAFLRRLPNGLPSGSVERLQREQAALRAQRGALLEAGPADEEPDAGQTEEASPAAAVVPAAPVPVVAQQTPGAPESASGTATVPVSRARRLKALPRIDARTPASPQSAPVAVATPVTMGRRAVAARGEVSVVSLAPTGLPKRAAAIQEVEVPAAPLAVEGRPKRTATTRQVEAPTTNEEPPSSRPRRAAAVAALESIRAFKQPVHVKATRTSSRGAPRYVVEESAGTTASVLAAESRRRVRGKTAAGK